MLQKRICLRYVDINLTIANYSRNFDYDILEWPSLSRLSFSIHTIIKQYHMYATEDHIVPVGKRLRDCAYEGNANIHRKVIYWQTIYVNLFLECAVCKQSHFNATFLYFYEENML